MFISTCNALQQHSAHLGVRTRTNQTTHRNRNMEVTSPRRASSFLRSVWQWIAGPRKSHPAAGTPISAPHSADLSANPEPQTKTQTLASACFAKIHTMLPKGMRSKISSDAKANYLDDFCKNAQAMRQAIPERFLADRSVALIAHELAFNKLQPSLPDPSSGAQNPDGSSQWETWVKMIDMEVREHLGFDKKKEAAHNERIFGNKTGAGDALRDSHKALLNNLLEKTHCESMAVQIENAVIARREKSHPTGLSPECMNECNLVYGLRHEHERAQLVAKYQMQEPFSRLSTATVYYMATIVAHINISHALQRTLPAEYLATKEAAGNERGNLLAARLFVPREIIAMLSQRLRKMPPTRQSLNQTAC